MLPKRQRGVTKGPNTSAEAKNVELLAENKRLKTCLQDIGKIITEALNESSGASPNTRAANILPQPSAEARPFIQVIPENSNPYLQEFPQYAPHNGGRWIQILPGGSTRIGPSHPPPPPPVVVKQENSSEAQHPQGFHVLRQSVVPEMKKEPPKDSEAVVPQGPSSPFFQPPKGRVRLNTSKGAIF